VIPEPSAVISGNAALMGAAVSEDDDIIDPEIPVDDEDEVEEVVERAERPARGERPERAERAEAPGEGGKKKRRRRRRRRGGAPGEGGAEADGSDQSGDDADGDDVADAAVTPAVEVAPEPPKKRTRSRTRKVADAVAAPDAVIVEPPVVADGPVVAELVEITTALPEPVTETAPAKKPARSRAKKPKVEDAPVLVADPGDAVAPEGTALIPDPQDPVAPEAAVVDAAVAAPVDDGPAKPKRKGWWSLAR
jgi:ribonuclease E